MGSAHVSRGVIEHQRRLSTSYTSVSLINFDHCIVIARGATATPSDGRGMKIRIIAKIIRLTPTLANINCEVRDSLRFRAMHDRRADLRYETLRLISC